MTTTPPTINPTCPPKHLGGGGPVRRSGAKEEQPPTINQQPPTLRGWVNTYYRHYKGRKLGPYYVRRWKVGLKIHRQYIKPEDVERVKAACQAHREGRRRINRFLDNFDFLGKIMDRYDTGRVVTPAMEDYIRRIHSEGPYITGRPQIRRKVKRTLATIDGQEMIIKTIFELDGTTKTFMVPFFINSLPPEERQGEVPEGGWGRTPLTKNLIARSFKTVGERFVDMAMEAFEAARAVTHSIPTLT